MRYGLLGKKLAHSYSPPIHQQLAGYDYELVELATPAAVADFLATTDAAGLNVTIPYKETVIPLCGELTPLARRIGAVNTLSRLPDGRWRGDNTDYYGFAQMMRGLDLRDRVVLLLGSGGAAKMARTFLTDAAAREVVAVSRSGAVNYENVYARADAEIVVNATPVGMYPHNGERLLDLTKFPRLRGVAEMIYHPDRTRLMLDAEALAIPAVGGLPMLVEQAARAAEIWTGGKIGAEKSAAVTRRMRDAMRNIALIGMPGCGKTTVGKRLAARLNREFIDTDVLVAERGGKPIPAIFADEGEEKFRQLESAVIAEVGKLSGKIIATGGGAVLRAENRDNLRQNSRVVYLLAPLAALATAGRPLSRDAAALAAMFAVRDPLYRQTAEECLDRDEAAEKLELRVKS
ncbi:MAG: AAA family ATPase [Planctomycetota bacterium]|jgi:shikimate dehydrogenase|nr:AAA family ATPase [Planctomycetota bacterium]